MKKIAAVIVVIVFCKSAQCQIGLGITTPHPNAYFQVNSINKGVLLPRMTAVQRLAIAPAVTANGLLVFDTDSSAYMFWTGTLWKKMNGDDGNWIKSGNNIYNSNTRNVGIGASVPLARLHVADSAVLFSGREDIDFSTPDPPPVTGIGSRMMWYPQKAAFRTGRLDMNCPDCWSKDSTGYHSVAGGYNPKAVGISSIALGAGVTAREAGSIALGIGSRAEGFAAFAAGNYAIAEQYASVAIGDQPVASGAGAFSLGNLTEAVGMASFAGGLRTKALGAYSFAAGNESEARADYAFAYGNAFANGAYSIAFGNQSVANGIGSFAAGNTAVTMQDYSFAFGNNVYVQGVNSFAFGDNVATGTDGAFVTGTYNDDNTTTPERIFEVANGTASLRQNAFTILKTGAVGIGTVDPQYRLDVAGNIHAQTDLLVDNYIQTNYFQTNEGVVTNNLTIAATMQSYKGRIMDSFQTRYFKLYDGFGIPGYVLTSDADGNGSWQPAASSSWSSNGTHIYNNNTGNVGIGNTDPSYLLDVNNRIRIRSGGDLSNSAGLWLNRTDNAALQAFVGIETDNTVGFYGSGSGWSFTMNTNTGKIKIADGTQADGRVLTSDANGIASWVQTNSNKAAVNATFPAGGGVNLTTAMGAAYTNLFIDLPPGKWLVIGTYLMSQGGSSLLAGQSMFVRTSFSSSNVANINTGDIIGSGLMSGNVGYPTPFAVMNGQNIINNTSGATKRYYVWASMTNTGGQPVGFFLNNFCGNFWSENNLVALPMN